MIKLIKSNRLRLVLDDDTNRYRVSKMTEFALQKAMQKQRLAVCD